MAGGPTQPLREPVFVGVHLAFGISLLIWHLLLRQLAGLGLVQAQMATAKKLLSRPAARLDTIPKTCTVCRHSMAFDP
jgi:hypothetical protein